MLLSAGKVSADGSAFCNPSTLRSTATAEDGWSVVGASRGWTSFSRSPLGSALALLCTARVVRSRSAQIRRCIDVAHDAGIVDVEQPDRRAGEQRAGARVAVERLSV